MPLSRRELDGQEQEFGKLQNDLESQILKFLTAHPDQLFTYNELEKQLSGDRDARGWVNAFIDGLFALVASGRVEKREPNDNDWNRALLSSVLDSLYGLAGSAKRIEASMLAAKAGLKDSILCLFRHNPDVLFTLREILSKVSMPMFLQQKSQETQVGCIVDVLIALGEHGGPVEERNVGGQRYYGRRA